MTDKPDCSEFIIEAARSLRQKPNRIRPPTASAGVALRRLYDIARDVYSEEEFRQGVKTLLNDGAVVVVARQGELECVDGQEHSKQTGPSRDVKVSALPEQLPFGFGKWYLNESNLSVAAQVAGKYRSYHSILLYVVADGLPDKVSNLDKRPNRRTAHDIIAAMQARK